MFKKTLKACVFTSLCIASSNVIAIPQTKEEKELIETSNENIHKFSPNALKNFIKMAKASWKNLTHLNPLIKLNYELERDLQNCWQRALGVDYRNNPRIKITYENILFAIPLL